MNPPLAHKMCRGGIALQNEYSIFSGEEEIGKVSVQRQGLYYGIRCRCTLTGAIRYKLIASVGESTVDLGLCVPMGDRFGVDTKIPIKRLGEGTLSFRLQPRHNRPQGKFVPVSPEEPFHYIRQLQTAHLARQEGVVGIIIPEDQISRESPTGQWSEPII